MSSTSQAIQTADAVIENAPPFFHLRLVGKVALTVSAVTGLVLVGVVIGASEQGGDGYAQIIEAFSVTRHNLGLAITLSSLVIVALAGLFAWLIAVYGSFRVAGPLFRFARNLELVAAEGPVPILGIREDDCLQEDAHRLAESVETLRRHYDEMRTLTEQIEAQLESPTPQDHKTLAATVLRLKKIDGKSRV